MIEIFMKVVDMNLTASIVALVVLLVRLFLKKAPKIYSYALWAVVFLRLICPFTIQLPTNDSTVQLQTIPNNIISYETPIYENTQEIHQEITENKVSEADSQVSNNTNSTSSVCSKKNLSQVLLEIASCIWIIGFIILIALSAISYLRLKTKLQTAIRVSDNIYESDRIVTPFVLGFVHPRIYIPVKLEEFYYVIKHEQMHIKRFDYIIKPIAFMITAVHWFNPIIWLSYNLMTSDMELSADEGVMKQLDSDIRAGYSKTLLALSVKKAGIFSPLAFGETGVKRRVKNVLNYKKPKVLVSVVAIIIVILSSIYLISGTEQSNGLGKNSGIKVTYPSDFVDRDLLGEFETKDSKIVSYINSVVEVGEIISVPEEDLEGNNIDRYKIETYDDKNQNTYILYYDTLYHKAYLKKDSGFVEADLDFARYVDSLSANLIKTTDIDEDIEALFGDYGWTLDYQIDILDYKLNNINVLSEADANSYYFAYNNELSKDIGLDMSDYSNSDIKAEIYRIRESLPEEFYPYYNCTGIVIKSDGKIIGAYISGLSTFSSCSLKGNSFEAATGKTVAKWIEERAEPSSDEEHLINLEPTQIIEEYFSALNQNDTTTAAYCLSRESIMGMLTWNIFNNQLYNEEISLPFFKDYFDYNGGKFGKLQSVELISVDSFEELGSDLDTDTIKYFAIDFNLQYENKDSLVSGVQNYNCTMVYESPQTGWKISDFGMG